MAKPEKDIQEFNVNLKVDGDIFKSIERQLIESTDRILKRISALEKQVSLWARQDKERDKMAQDTLDDIFTEVERNTSVGNSIVTLVERLLTQQGVDPARRAAILDALRADTAKLEEVVLANTPAEPPTA